METQIEKILRWSIFGGVIVVLAVGWVRHATDVDEVEPCLDPTAASMVGDLDGLHRARAELQRQRSAHERALGQLRADPLWADPEQQPWLAGAVADEEAILDELTAEEAGLAESESCLELDPNR